MSWQIEWQFLEKRLNGFQQSTQAFFLANGSVESDHHGVSSNYLIPNAKNIAKDIESFQKRNSAHLTTEANSFISDFLQRINAKNARYAGWSGAHAMSTLLAVFKAEFSFLISKIDSISKNIVERSFIHLNRSIVADSTIKSKWQAAFKAGEPACESLGAAHLLASGIWAFKAHSSGERTDLILHEPINSDDVARTGSALVLTEWKLVRKESEIISQVEQAVSQNKSYASGSLAGFELSSHRYVIIVSEDYVKLPTDRIENGIAYRNINIAVSPSTPSKR